MKKTRAVNSCLGTSLSQSIHGKEIVVGLSWSQVYQPVCILLHGWHTFNQSPLKSQPKPFKVPGREFSNDVGRRHNYPFREESLQKLNMKSKSHMKESLATTMRFFLVIVLMVHSCSIEQLKPKANTRYFSFSHKGFVFLVTHLAQFRESETALSTVL